MGTGLNQPAAKIQAGIQVLSQEHKTMWENTVQQVIPSSAVTMDDEVAEVFDAFALMCMGPRAHRKQKRCMSSGSIQMPKTWSSSHVTNRLTMLSCYLQ